MHSLAAAATAEAEAVEWIAKWVGERDGKEGWGGVCLVFLFEIFFFYFLLLLLLYTTLEEEEEDQQQEGYL